MSEILAFQPKLKEGLETVEVPSETEQAEFFEAVFSQIDAMEDPALHKKGPWLDEFTLVEAEFNEQLKRVDAGLKHDALYDQQYQSAETKRRLQAIGHWGAGRVGNIAKDRMKLLSSLAKEMTLPTLCAQELPKDMFDTPPYVAQSNEHTCSVACFRMIFGALAGWQPDEYVVVDKLKKSMADDEVLHKMFKSEVFKDATSKKVTTIDMVGADFACLETLASKLKARSDVSGTYCVASLASEDKDLGLTRGAHRVVLLAADGEKVSYHDPRIGANMEASYEKFATRWAVMSNRVEVTVAQDLVAK